MHGDSAVMVVALIGFCRPSGIVSNGIVPISIGMTNDDKSV